MNNFYNLHFYTELLVVAFELRFEADAQRTRIGFGAEHFLPFAKPNIVFNRIPTA